MAVYIENTEVVKFIPPKDEFIDGVVGKCVEHITRTMRTYASHLQFYKEFDSQDLLVYKYKNKRLEIIESVNYDLGADLSKEIAERMVTTLNELGYDSSSVYSSTPSPKFKLRVNVVLPDSTQKIAPVKGKKNV